MVLETYIKLCMTEPDFLEKKFSPKNWESGPEMGQKQGFLIYSTNLSLLFTEFML